jgi:type 1 glutamine amidotransferase
MDVMKKNSSGKNRKYARNFFPVLFHTTTTATSAEISFEIRTSIKWCAHYKPDVAAVMNHIKGC